MLKNITLTAEEDLLERARSRAAEENSTLNAEFRKWLEKFVERPQSIKEFLQIMSRLEYAEPGRLFSREELNER